MPHTSKDGDTVIRATHDKGAAGLELTAAATALAAAPVTDAAKLAAYKRLARARERKIQADRRAAEFGA